MKSSRRSYTAEQREQALTLAGEIGSLAAARQLGIPKSTLSHWRHRPRTKTPPAPEPARPTSQKRTPLPRSIQSLSAFAPC